MIRRCDRDGKPAFKIFWFRDEHGLDRCILCKECEEREKPENDPDYIGTDEFEIRIVS